MEPSNILRDTRFSKPICGRFSWLSFQIDEVKYGVNRERIVRLSWQANFHSHVGILRGKSAKR